MSEPAKAVFLSYASQDAEAVRRIAEALRAAGVEVWFDQNELVGGDAWDAKIRGQIASCALFVPVISANTQARLEGYFRIEWKLAAQRTHAMAEEKAFLLPVVIDGTRDADAKVPAEFRAVQWTRLLQAYGEQARIAPAGSLDAFCERVKGLLGSDAGARASSPAPLDAGVAAPVKRVSSRRRLVPAILGIAAVVALTVWQPWRKTEDSPTTVGPTPPPTAAQRPSDLPAKSVAVLAFKNVGGDPTNEAIVEGIGLELISMLGRVPGLTVRGNSSLSYFNDSDATTQEKGRKLDVTYLVDGSVQRAGDTLRISANLTRAATNEIVWSSAPLNRSVREIFSVQEEMAGLIAKNLSLTLGAGSASSRASVNPEAVELYVRARQAWNLRTTAGFAQAEELLNRALVLEPNFARAHAALADVWSIRGQDDPGGASFGARHSPLRQKVTARIRRALELDSESAEAHASLGSTLWTGWEFAGSERALRRAIELNPNYASAHQWLGRMLLAVGRMDEAMVELKMAVALDPLSARIADNFALGLFCAGRLSESLAAYEQALAVQPGALQASWQKARVLHRLGRQDEASTILRGIPDSDWPNLATRLSALASSGLNAEAAALIPGLDPKTEDLAYFLTRLGRFEEAMAALNPATTESTQIEEWLFMPEFDPLRHNPRFEKFLATLGQTEAHARAQAWRAAHPPEKVEAKK